MRFQGIPLRIPAISLYTPAGISTIGRGRKSLDSTSTKESWFIVLIGYVYIGSYFFRPFCELQTCSGSKRLSNSLQAIPNYELVASKEY